MTKKIIRTILPIAPQEYDPVYINQLARSLDRLIDEVRSTDINIQGISGEGSANTLHKGDLIFGDGGFLRIVEQDDKLAGSVFGTTQLGSVTISTS